jgi:hypothetical protein
MATIPNSVSPGDLILANLFNEVVIVLNDHEQRLQKLEQAAIGTSAVVITAVVPTGSVRMGTQLQLIGRNFGVPALNQVNINGTPVSGFKTGSSDTLLIFDIPNVQGIAAQGQTATINLSNANGFATATIFLLPGQPVTATGQLFLAMSQPPQVALITAGADFIYTFALTGVTSMDETYTVQTAMSTGWPAVLVNSDNNPISPPQVVVPQGNPPNGVNTLLRVKVSVPAGTANATAGQLTLTVTSRTNPTGLTVTSPQMAITVGSPPSGAQDALVVQIGNVFSPGTLTAGTIAVPATGAQVRVDLAVMVKNPGTYVVQPPSFAAATGWTVQLVGGTFTTTSAGANQLVTMVLTATTGAQPTNLTVRITGQTDQTVTGQLVQAVRPA